MAEIGNPAVHRDKGSVGSRFLRKAFQRIQLGPFDGFMGIHHRASVQQGHRRESPAYVRNGLHLTYVLIVEYPDFVQTDGVFLENRSNGGSRVQLIG